MKTNAGLEVAAAAASRLLDVENADADVRTWTQDSIRQMMSGQDTDELVAASRILKTAFALAMAELAMRGILSVEAADAAEDGE